MAIGISGIRTDLPIGKDKNGNPIYMKDSPQSLNFGNALQEYNTSKEFGTGKEVYNFDNPLANPPPTKQSPFSQEQLNIMNTLGAPTFETSKTPQVATPQYTQQAQTQTIQKPQFDIRAEMEKLKAAQLAAATAGLDKAKAGALSNLSAEQAKIQPMAIADRNKADISMNNTNKSWSDFLAAKGLSQSGSAALGTGLNQAQYLGNVGSINRDATNKEADILRRTTDVNNNYLSDLEAARAGIETNYLNRMIDQMNTDRNFDYQAGRDTIDDNRYNKEYSDSREDIAYNRNYQLGRDTISDNRYNQEYSDNRSDINYDRNYQASRDAVLDKRYTDETFYKKEQDRLDNQFRSNQFDWQKEQSELDREWQKGQFNYQKSRDMVSDSRYKAEWQQKLDEYAWSKSQDNPQVKGQILNNQISALELKYLPETQKLQLQQLKKQIAQIGAVKPMSDYEKKMQEVELDTAKKKLDLLGAPDEKAVIASKVNAIISDLSKDLPRSAYAELNNHPNDYIPDIGVEEYNKLLALYKKRAEMGDE